MVTFLKDVFHLFFAGMYRCNERQYISSYLGIIVTIGLSGTVTEI